MLNQVLRSGSVRALYRQRIRVKQSWRTCWATRAELTPLAQGARPFRQRHLQQIGIWIVRSRSKATLASASFPAARPDFRGFVRGSCRACRRPATRSTPRTCRAPGQRLPEHLSTAVGGRLRASRSALPVLRRMRPARLTDEPARYASSFCETEFAPARKFHHRAAWERTEYGRE